MKHDHDHSFLTASYKRNNIKKTPFHKFSLIDTVSLGVLATGQTVLARICDELDIDYDNEEAHSFIRFKKRIIEFILHI